MRFSQGRPRWRPWQWWLIATVQATALHAMAFLLVNGLSWWAVPGFVVSLAAPALALAGFMAWDRQLQLPSDLNARWWRQGVIAVLAPALGMVGIPL